MRNKKFWMSLIAGLMAVIMLLGLILSILPHKVSAAQSSSEIKNQIAEMEKENEAVEKELEALEDKLADLKAEQNENKSELQAILSEKDLIDEQIGLMHSQLTNMNEQIAAFNVLIADQQEELEKAEKILEEMNEKYKERIRAMEEDGDLSYWSVLFEANSFFDLLDRMNMVQEIAAADARRLEQLRQAHEEVQAAQEALLAEKEALAQARKDLEQTQAEFLQKGVQAQELLATLTAKMDEMSDQADEYKDLMGKLEDQMEDFEVQLGKLETDLDKALYEEYLATMTTAPTIPVSKPGGTGATGGQATVDDEGNTWVIPCSYSRVSSAYGWRIHPVYGDRRFHHGVDLNASCKMKSDGTTDSPIYASRAGVVTVATYNGSAGWYVKIDHLNGFSSAYMHMCCKPFVSVGEVVVAGQVIGCIGTTGTSTGDHLHFSIYYNGQSVNPMEYIG